MAPLEHPDATDDLPPSIGNPARRALGAGNVTRLSDLSVIAEADVASWHGVGPKALDILRRALAATGRSFATTGTGSVAEKLRIGPGAAVWSSSAAGLALLGPLPDGVRAVPTPDEATTAIIVADDAVSLRATLETHRGHLAKPANVWVVNRKATRSDLNRDRIRTILQESGLWPTGHTTVDEIWSASRFYALAPGDSPLSTERR